MTWVNDNKKTVAANDSQVNILLAVTCIFWLIAKIISWKLWVTERLFPVIPAFDFLSAIPAMAHWVLLFSSIALLIALTVRPGNKTLQYILLFVELFACMLDENRWQPWEYLYLFILLLFILNKSGKTAVLHSSFVIVLATIYFYSGIHKMQEGFVTYMWDHIILKRMLHLPIPFQSKNWLHYCGYALPLVECIAGIGLLFAATKKIAAILLIAMHVFILMLLGPWGIQYNVIVWPWNIAMIFYLYYVFIQNENESFFQIHLYEVRYKLLLFCWAVLPALNFIGWWDHYLSWNLYSHTLPTMTICLKDSLPGNRLQPYLSKKVNPLICDGNVQLNIQTWAMKEMNVPPYPEVRNYKKIKAHWIKNDPLTNADIIIYDFTFFGRRIEVK